MNVRNMKTKGFPLTLPVVLFLLLLGNVLYTYSYPAAAAVSIKVLYPNGGEVLKTGGKIAVKWQSKGLDGKAKVIIILYKKGIKHSVIAKKTENSGVFAWKIPRNLPGGKDYRVRIRALKDLSVNDFSDGNFTILAQRK